MLENRILEARQTLVNVTMDMEGLNPEFARQKIFMLENDIEDMSRQISYLKGVCAKNGAPGMAQEPMAAPPMETSGMAQPPMGMPGPGIAPSMGMPGPGMAPPPMGRPGMMPPPPMGMPGPGMAPPPMGRPGMMPPPMEKPGMMPPPMPGPAMANFGNGEPVMRDRETPGYGNMPYNPNMVNRPVKNNSDFEKTFGKSFMGVAASVLIFISIILFATLLLPILNDAAKMVIMYLVSGAFLGAGTYRLRKDRDNKFNISLTGCGLGALYISLLLSNIYFKVLGDIPLYVLIAFWGCLVCLYAKKKNYIFQAIGEIGILISMIFGCILCADAEDPAKFIALLIFYAITSAIFYIVNYEREFEENLCYHFFALVGTVILTIWCVAVEGDKWTICRLIAIIIQILNMAGLLTHRLNKCEEWIAIISSAYMVSLAVMSGWLIPNDDTWGIVAYVVCMIMVLILSFRKNQSNIGLETLSITSIIIAFVGLCVHGDAYNYGIVWLMIIPMLLLGYFRKNNVLKGIGLVIMMLHLFIYDYDYKGLHFLFMLIAFAVAYLCMFLFKKQYSRTIKELLHIVALVFIATQMYGAVKEVIGTTDGDMEVLILSIVYACFFILNVVASKTKFATNFITGEKEGNGDVYVVANVIAMIWGTVLVCYNDFAVSHFINIIVSFAAYMLGTKNALNKEGKNIGNNIYVGIKFTIYLITVFASFDAPNYVVSVGCLLLAILFILIGFKGGYKYLRIYGLGLTMLSIFKLLMVDAHYENTLGNAISFFVSGVLCFAISMIYNYLDKKMGNKD